MTTRITITGATGKMGHALLEAIKLHPEATLSYAISRTAPRQQTESPSLPQKITEYSFTSDSEKAIRAADVVIDFSRPDMTMEYLKICLEANKPLVIGTTGLSAAQLNQVKKAGESLPIVMAANMSIGINLLAQLVQIAARTLQSGYDIEIIEAHHRQKVDAPSGTALFLGQQIASSLELDLDSNALFCRQGHTGVRPRSQIGFSVIRGGDIVGDHTVLFAGDGERIELTHKASSRLTFANGAIRAALYVLQKKPGLYNMQDVISLR
ncbi:MAG: 4-hydroxy-tetrahydrodipicolinate reductase [Proteobacteria bacterium]|nr:4-hydroxy-tetrahydrodipicolinate reductase [Pseudomonadota bacterium]